jgi:acid stress-induced BolA-like protein IbaG/YrbA
MFGSVSEHFAYLRHVKRCKTCVRTQMHYIRYQSCEASILVYWTQNDVWECSDHFANLQHVKRWKTCVSSLNALFRGTKLAKHPFYSIETKMMFGSISEHFANLRHVERLKTCVRTRMHYLRVPKLWNLHSSLLDPKWCLGVFQSISLTFNV